MTEDFIFVTCSACDGEGRDLRQGWNCWDEIDRGPCAMCDGTGIRAEMCEPAEMPEDFCPWP